MKLKLQTDAEKDLDVLRNRLEAERQASSAFTIEQRKVELQSKKEVLISELRETLNRRIQATMDSKNDLHNMKVRNLKKESESQHENEMELIKNKRSSKLQLEKDKINDVNMQLIEESTDIDLHIQAFRNDMISTKVDEEKYKSQHEFRKKLKDHRAANN